MKRRILYRVHTVDILETRRVENEEEMGEKMTTCKLSAIGEIYAD